MSRVLRKPWFRRMGTYRRVTALVFLGLLVAGTTTWGQPYFFGSTSGTRTVGVVPLVDPLAAVEIGVASRVVGMETVIGAGLLIGFAMVVGPVFCGWVCPLGLVLELNHTLRNLLVRPKKLARVARPISWEARVAVLGAFVGFALVARAPVFQIVSPINLLARALLFGSLLGLIVVGAIVVVEWVWPRLWCRSLCPLGALYGLVGRFGLLRVRVDPERAGKTPCQRCSAACPMGIEVMEGYVLRGATSVTHPGCTRCGACTDTCPRATLKLSLFGFGRGRHDGGVDDGTCEVEACDGGVVSLPVMGADGAGAPA
jgi:ferredoxin-type protein NapH